MTHVGPVIITYRPVIPWVVRSVTVIWPGVATETPPVMPTPGNVTANKTSGVSIGYDTDGRDLDL